MPCLYSFLLWNFQIVQQIKIAGGEVAGDHQDFLKTDFVVKYKGLFVCLNLGNSTFQMCISEWLC